MKHILQLIFLFTISKITLSQNFTGQWKGGFIDKSTSMYSWGGQQSDYVLDLDVAGKNVSGYSYTYFTTEGKKYYTICKVKGVIDAKKKYIEVTETERTKTNIPQNITNSFQLHKLSWKKSGNEEILEGTWEPAPGQDRSKTGYGTTVLSRRQLSEISPLAKKLNAANKPTNPLSNTIAIKTKKNPLSNAPSQQPIAGIKKATPSKPKATSITKLNHTSKPATAIQKPTASPTPNQPDIVNNVLPKTIEQKPQKEIVGFEKRKNTIIQTISTVSETVTIELYDNGDIDGDSVSLFYNGEVLISHKRLTDQAIKLTIPVENNAKNELVMYAENLGTIPPNTALLIVTDGKKRYELRITSDLEKSGAIKFVHTQKE